MHGLRPPSSDLDLGNSGTSMRLLSGLLSGQRFASTLVGDASLSKRPMRRVTDPLAEMGAHIGTTEQGTAPLRIEPVSYLHPHRLRNARGQRPGQVLPVACRLSMRLATSCVTEPATTRDHTERMLTGFGYALHRDGPRVCIRGGGHLSGCRLDVPGDISSAAFFLVGASIAPGSDLTLEHVGVNPTRIGVLNILRAMGADIEILNPRDAGGEPVADLRVRSAALRGIRIPQAQVPLAIDEFPALFIAAACAEGETLLSGAQELRVKESDRIQVMAEGLAALGVEAEPRADGIRIRGGDLGGGLVDSRGDHRIAMAFAIAASEG